MAWKESQAQDSEAQPMSAPYIQTPRDTLGMAMITMTDTEPELHNFELFLRSCREDDNGALIQIGEPLVNNYGAVRLVGIAQALANKIIEFGDHDRNSINNWLRFANDTIVKNLMVNRRPYEIRNDSARDDIHFNFMATIYACLNRGMQGGERRFWKGSVLEMRQSMETDKSKGIFSKWWNK